MNSRKDLFLALAKPDDDGFSRLVLIEEFVGDYRHLEMGNGGSWCRDDGSLAKEFNIERRKEKGRIIGVQLHGFNKRPINKTIRADIMKHYQPKKCVLLATSKPEVDHKDGRRDDPRLFITDTQTVNDFQPLSKAANNAKRQHCKTCRKTSIRFDAKHLGYAFSYLKGDAVYRGTCVGCYWYDPTHFNTKISQNYTPN